MVSLWGSNKDDDANGSDSGAPRRSDDGPRRRSYDEREPDERTRLLHHPPPPNSDGYLDPDDPAVRIAPISAVELLLNCPRSRLTTFGVCDSRATSQSYSS